MTTTPPVSPESGISFLTERPAWHALERHYHAVKDLHLRTLFANDPARGERLTAEAAGLYLDYSKNRITDDTLRLLVQLAEHSGLRARIDGMFRGDTINITDQRAVLHVALRAPRDASFVVDGANVVPPVHAVLDKMADFCTRVRSFDGLGDWPVHHAGYRPRALPHHPLRAQPAGAPGPPDRMAHQLLRRPDRRGPAV